MIFSLTWTSPVLVHRVERLVVRVVSRIPGFRVDLVEREVREPAEEVVDETFVAVRRRDERQRDDQRRNEHRAAELHVFVVVTASQEQRHLAFIQ